MKFYIRGICEKSLEINSSFSNIWKE